MIRRLVLIFFLLLLALYAGDYLSVRYRIPGNRAQLGFVQTRTSYAVEQKNRKTEYYFNPAEAETCVHSLFPQLGYTPCWYLARHSVKQIQM
jgi:hypothetical protein